MGCAKAGHKIPRWVGHGKRQPASHPVPRTEELEDLTGLLSSQNGARGSAEPAHLAFLTP